MKNNLLLNLVSLILLPSVLHGQDIMLDREISMENAKKIENTMGVISAIPASDYIHDLDNKLIGNVNQPFPFEFNLIDSEIPDAFALPGGFVYVTWDLMALVNSGDELAGVISHEIVHVLERHSVKQEIQSDKIGTELAVNTGFHPIASSEMLQSISSAASYYSGETRKKSNFDDHPYTTNRAAKIKKSSAGLTIRNEKPIAGTRESFYNKLKGMLFGKNPAHGVFQK